MSKQDAKREKNERNNTYAMRYRQKVCQKCKHRSCRPGACRVCGGPMKP